MGSPLDILAIEANIVTVLKNVFDPEIPVNIYDLGLIYEVDVEDDGKTTVKMTLTAPNCPMADQLLQEVNDRVGEVEGVSEVIINLTFDPPWDKSMMSDEALLELGFL
ncbi:MAG TPA: iron-sulfur cluster assembly protein [Tenuifilaceae bacterium]|nr:iron-sulfur cluster assembly protein [Tenuifilaceae bacterium]HPE17762.1 iron-sulfur cluster assembly protein [Tenuifilaceae bacterium]HPJ45035.1 iron-sulfur cluster assembly protein [Tenuifilaceae bacterium]HPQ34141.1 iron-sulfur cluster assembly protein [Tenuifilaceae bacterium]HRX67159.1 iron-sulfur cluster assembly protein [Tenuifilaceae bacterium]